MVIELQPLTNLRDVYTSSIFRRLYFSLIYMHLQCDNKGSAMRAASLPDVKSLLRNTEALESLIETLQLCKYWQNWVFPTFTLKRLKYFCLYLPGKKKCLRQRLIVELYSPNS